MLMIALHGLYADYLMARNNHAIIKRDLHRARQAGDHHLVPELDHQRDLHRARQAGDHHLVPELDHQRDILQGMLQEATEQLGHYRPLP